LRNWAVDCYWFYQIKWWSNKSTFSTLLGSC